MKAFATVLLSLLLCFACGNSAEVPEASSTPTAPASAPTAGAPAQPRYPPIPLERLEFLWDNATYSDATFYELPISTNQSEQAQIRTSLSFIAAESPVLDPNCKAIGHLWFQVDGQNREEADIHFGPNCAYYVWYENGQPAYANYLTQAGVDFYNRIFASVPQNAQ